MSSESLEVAKSCYKSGKVTFKNGDYRKAIEQLEEASTLLPPETKLAGDVKIWLVTAYEAIGKNEDAVALCEILKKYPCLETSREANHLDYILTVTNNTIYF